MWAGAHGAGPASSMTHRRPLSVITATPPGFNPGMLASQVAARWFLHRHQLDREATFFRLMPISNRLGKLDPGAAAACLQRVDDGIDHHDLLHADQLADTTPLYWGDLLHMRQYLNSIRGLMPGSHATPEDLLLLKSSSMDVVRRAVSFGTTFLYHSAGDLTNDAFAPTFCRFVENARLVMPRDIVSLAQLSALAPRTLGVLGLDATQLFCGADWRRAFPEGTDTSLAIPESLLCYFARGKHDTADLRQAIRLFSQAFGQPVRWLPWGDRFSFRHIDAYEGRLDVESLSAGRPVCLSALLEALAAARCVLTDTYHVAVIAWSLGTPAMLVRGDHWPGDYNAVVDKRYVFYVQHGLQDFFLNNARDHAEIAAFIRRGVGLVSEGKTLQWYSEMVEYRAEAVERRLVSALKGDDIDE
jgi:hypothetical protein